jgi:MinD-like ATPase involved in chromosome partitioning or flagellar assembly
MGGVRIPHDLTGEDRFILGLSVSRVAVLLFGSLGGYTLLRLPWPLALRLVPALATWAATAAFVWLRPGGQTLTHWAGAAIEYWLANLGRPRPAPAPTPTLQAGQTRVGPKLAVLSASSSALPPDGPSSTDEDVLELPPGRREFESPSTTVREPTSPAPVYLGGPQVVCFFAIKGGSGRTTLATESACLLAARGWYRESPREKSKPLRVALLDFDLGSANVSVRLGLAQPTILDYLTALGMEPPRVADYLLEHDASGLSVLLGPPKCLTGTGPLTFGVSQAAEIMASLKADGYQYIFVDVGPTLTDLVTFVLQAADHIYYVVTPTAGSIQDLYRGVEALRRVGLGPKLRYVVNKVRRPMDFSEPMGDLGGYIEAEIPYDQAFETAENRHQPCGLSTSGDTQRALLELAATIYPALSLPETGAGRLRRFGWFGRAPRVS